MGGVDSEVQETPRRSSVVQLYCYRLSRLDIRYILMPQALVVVVEHPEARRRGHVNTTESRRRTYKKCVGGQQLAISRA
jgi:hypothetical protein